MGSSLFCPAKAKVGVAWDVVNSSSVEDFWMAHFLGFRVNG